MESIKVTEGQTLFDIAIQKLGSAEAAFQLALANGLSVTSSLAAGQDIVLSTEVDKNIVSFFARKGIVSATYSATIPEHEGNIEVIYRSGNILQDDTRVKITEGQSLFDVAIQKLGSAEAVFELAEVNGLSITDELVPGQSIKLSKVWDADISGFYYSRNIVPVSTCSDLYNQEIVQEGIGYWAIEVDFVVS